MDRSAKGLIGKFRRFIRTRRSSGFIVQLFFFTVLPLTILLFLFSVINQNLHHKAMRELVGDRDLRTAMAAADAIDQQLDFLSSSLISFADEYSSGSEFSSNQERFINQAFPGGMAIFSKNLELENGVQTELDWRKIFTDSPDIFPVQDIVANQVYFSPVRYHFEEKEYLFALTKINDSHYLAGAFEPANVIGDSIKSLSTSYATSIMIISSIDGADDFDFLFSSGELNHEMHSQIGSGFQDVLDGKSGFMFYGSHDGEHVVAFSPIKSTGWGLITEEAWEDIADPTLIRTQSTSLLILPVLALILLTVWWGVNQVIKPMQTLGKRAVELARGNYQKIHEPVGGIEEIKSLQDEMVALSDAVQVAQSDLHNYIGAITSGVENERSNVARELHDDTIQTLIALNQRVQLMLKGSSGDHQDTLEEIQRLVQTSMKNLRRVIRGLRPIYLEDLGLAASLKMLTQDLGSMNGMNIEYSLDGVETRQDPLIELSLYRIAQEALNNALFHAEAVHIHLTLKYSDASILLTVRDDGKGFLVPAQFSEYVKNEHYGLLGMKERAELMGAHLKILSIPDGGTLITVKKKI